MSGLISELIKVVTEESQYYDKLIEMSMDKKEFIIKNDISSLKDLTGKENTFAGKLQRLEKKRMSLITDIANVLNEKEANITLNYLADIIDEPTQSKDMKALSIKLKESISKLKELNDQNRILIENALDYIDFSMNVIRSSLTDSPAMYDAKGEEVITNSNLFDVRN